MIQSDAVLLGPCFAQMDDGKLSAIFTALDLTVNATESLVRCLCEPRPLPFLDTTEEICIYIFTIDYLMRLLTVWAVSSKVSFLLAVPTNYECFTAIANSVHIYAPRLLAWKESKCLTIRTIQRRLMTRMTTGLRTMKGTTASYLTQIMWKCIR